MNDERKTDPSELGPVEPDTADLSKDAEIARKITEIYENLSGSLVPLRTDIETLSSSIRGLTDSTDGLSKLIGSMMHEIAVLGRRVERVEKHLSLAPLPDEAAE